LASDGAVENAVPRS